MSALMGGPTNPIFDPAAIADNAARGNVEAAIGMSVVNAVNAAINPSPEQRELEDRKRKEESDKRKADDDKQRQELDDAAAKTTKLQVQVSQSTGSKLDGSQVKDVLSAIERAEEGTSPMIGDIAAVQFASDRERMVQTIANKGPDQVNALIDIPELAGRTPEIKLRGVVVRLQQDPDQASFAAEPDVELHVFDRGPKIRELPDGSVIASVEIEYLDNGQKTRLDIKFGPAQGEEAAPEGLKFPRAGKPTSQRLAA